MHAYNQMKEANKQHEKKVPSLQFLVHMHDYKIRLFFNSKQRNKKGIKYTLYTRVKNGIRVITNRLK